MSESIFNQIRARCAEVAGRARWVQIDYGKLATYPEVLDLSAEPELAHTEEHHLLHSGDATLAYFLILDSINFGSGYFPFLEKDQGASGYFTVAKRLKEWIVDHGIPAPEYLRSINAAGCAAILRQDMRNRHAEELMELFALALNQLGAWLIDECDGNYLAVFAQAQCSADVVAAVTRMPFYRDVSLYGNVQVPFLKRAQILVQDVTVAEPGHQLLQYPDLDQLTAFSDNVLAYVLKADGILKYDPWLEERIQRGELIGAGSFEEIEIRVCTIHAVESLCSRINERTAMVMRELDFHLWNRGQKLKKRVPDLRHRTRCVYY